MDSNQYLYMLNEYISINKLETRLDWAANKFKISFSQYLMLKKISEDHCNEPSLLARAFGVSNPAVSRKLTDLYKRGLIIKNHSEWNGDQRKVNLVVSADGEEVLKALNRIYAEWLSPVASDKELAVYIKKFLEITDNLIDNSFKNIAD